MNSRLNNKEEWINELKGTIMEITQSEQQTERQMKKNESSIWDLWDNIKHANLQIIGIPEEKTEKEIQTVFEEFMAEHFPNLKKQTNIQVQEAKRVLKEMNQTDPHQDTALKWQKLTRGF